MRKVRRTASSNWTRFIAAFVPLIIIAAMLTVVDSSASSESGAAGPTTTRPVLEGEVETFVQVATQNFPDLSEKQARCIADRSLPYLTLATIGALLGAQQSPLMAPPDDRRVLAAAINDCVERATAVAVLSRRALELAGMWSVGENSSFSYPELSCIDERLGGLSFGEAFFDLYERPADFQRPFGRSLDHCLDGDHSLSILSTWIAGASASPLTPTDESGMVPLDPVTEVCLRQAVDHRRKDAGELLAQAVLSQSPDELGDELRLVEQVFFSCGLPLPRKGSV